ncbi:MAG: biopolymer transporter ExbD [Saprospiraceae bacterium]
MHTLFNINRYYKEYSFSFILKPNKMAEMNVISVTRNHQSLKRRPKRSTTRVDLTSMVDLGFLLITFFMLATSFNDHKSMEVIKPVSNGKTQIMPLSKTLTLMLSSTDKVVYYNLPATQSEDMEFYIDSTNYGSNGIRKIIRKRQEEVKQLYSNQDELFIMIKPLPKSKYKNLIDVLDEMMINNVKKYAIVAPNEKIDSIVALKINESRK